MNGRHVVAFVDDDVAVAADQLVKVIAARECLDHCDVDPSRQSASASAESPDRLRCDVEELAEPLDPLLDERLAVDEDQRGAPSTGDEVRSEHRFAPARGCAEDADVMLQKRSGSGLLGLVELAGKLELKRLAIRHAHRGYRA